MAAGERRVGRQIFFSFLSPSRSIPPLLVDVNVDVSIEGSQIRLPSPEIETLFEMEGQQPILFLRFYGLLALQLLLAWLTCFSVVSFTNWLDTHTHIDTHSHTQSEFYRCCFSWSRDRDDGLLSWPLPCPVGFGIGPREMSPSASIPHSCENTISPKRPLASHCLRRVTRKSINSKSTNFMVNWIRSETSKKVAADAYSETHLLHTMPVGSFFPHR